MFRYFHKESKMIVLTSLQYQKNPHFAHVFSPAFKRSHP